MPTGQASLSLSFPDSSAISFISFVSCLLRFASFFESLNSVFLFAFRYKNVRSDHSINGRQPRAIRGSNLKRPGFRMSLCPSLAWGGCRGREFPRTCASPHPVPTLTRVMEGEFSVTVIRHMRKIKLWKSSERSRWDHFDLPGNR